MTEAVNKGKLEWQTDQLQNIEEIKEAAAMLLKPIQEALLVQYLVLVAKTITRWKMAQHECIVVAMIALRIGTCLYLTHCDYLP